MSPPITRGQMVVFALPALVSVVMYAPIAGILPALYVAKFGFSLAAVATVLLAARVLDAAIDPLIGLLSDRTESRLGKRKPWILAGAFSCAIVAYFLYNPGSQASMTYFLVLMLLLPVAWTLIEIPYSAWTLELSRNPIERTRLNAYRSAAMLLAGILFTIAPMLVAQSGGSMTFEVLGAMGAVLLIAVPLSAVAAAKFVPVGEVYDSGPPPTVAELWRSVAGNRPFMIFLLMYVFIGLASGINGILSFIYIDSHLGIGNRYTELMLPAVIAAPLSLPVWLALLKRFDRHRMTAIAFAIYALLMPLPWFIDPGPASFLPMAILFAAGSVFVPLLMVTMPTILGDVIDYDELQTGKNRSGQYNAFLTMVAKGTGAVGGPIALAIVGWFGFQPGASTNSESAVTALRIIYNVLPTLLVIPAVLLVWYFPINGQRQREIHAQLLARAEHRTHSAVVAQTPSVEVNGPPVGQSMQTP